MSFPRDVVMNTVQATFGIATVQVQSNGNPL